MKKRQRKKEYKKNKNVFVPLIPVKVNQKEKKISKSDIFFSVLKFFKQGYLI